MHVVCLCDADGIALAGDVSGLKKSRFQWKYALDAVILSWYGFNQNEWPRFRRIREKGQSMKGPGIATSILKANALSSDTFEISFYYLRRSMAKLAHVISCLTYLFGKVLEVT